MTPTYSRICQGAFLSAITLFVHVASALDCVSAKTDSERTACVSAQASETAMHAAHDRLKTRISTSREQAALEASQDAWLKVRDEACTSNKFECLSRLNRERQGFLEGRTPDVLVPPSRTRPFFAHRASSADSVEVSATTVKFINPQNAAESLLNHFMEKQLEQAIEFGRHPNDVSPAPPYYSVMSSDLNHVSPELLSASVDGSYFVGQAHPEPWRRSLNIDMRTGKSLKFSDLLDAGNAKRLFAFCQNQVTSKKIEKWGDPQKGNVSLGEISKLGASLDNWNFTKSEARISYSVYAFGGYGECNCTCNIPYSTLRSLAKKTFPLPK